MEGSPFWGATRRRECNLTDWVNAKPMTNYRETETERERERESRMYTHREREKERVVCTHTHAHTKSNLFIAITFQVGCLGVEGIHERVFIALVQALATSNTDEGVEVFLWRSWTAKAKLKQKHGKLNIHPDIYRLSTLPCAKPGKYYHITTWARSSTHTHTHTHTHTQGCTCPGTERISRSLSSSSSGTSQPVLLMYLIIAASRANSWAPFTFQRKRNREKDLISQNPTTKTIQGTLTHISLKAFPQSVPGPTYHVNHIL